MSQQAVHNKITTKKIIHTICGPNRWANKGDSKV